MNRIEGYFPSDLNNKPSGENYNYEVQGWHIPIELVHEYETLHSITAEEFLLLSRIENLVQYGKGCFASNAWLAERQNCSTRRIQQMLQSLKMKGFIKTWRKDGKRYMKTLWTRSIKKRRKKKPPEDT